MPTKKEKTGYTIYISHTKHSHIQSYSLAGIGKLYEKCHVYWSIEAKKLANIESKIEERKNPNWRSYSEMVAIPSFGIQQLYTGYSTTTISTNRTHSIYFVHLVDFSSIKKTGFRNVILSSFSFWMSENREKKCSKSIFLDIFTKKKRVKRIWK